MGKAHAIAAVVDDDLECMSPTFRSELETTLAEIKGQFQRAAQEKCGPKTSVSQWPKKLQDARTEIVNAENTILRIYGVLRTADDAWVPTESSGSLPAAFDKLIRKLNDASAECEEAGDRGLMDSFASAKRNMDAARNHAVHEFRL